jgi:multimeric flavodoxin WrbA
MRICVLMGSPRKQGNTMQALAPFLEEWEQAGHFAELIWLYEKEIRPCLACRVCQDVMDGFGCVQKDDVEEIAQKICKADGFVLATPIYAWYCTAPMKAMLDRLVYGMNKYYGRKKGPVLWRGKPCALFLTGGYPEEESGILFEKGMEGYCKHSRLAYQGALFLRDFGYHTTFFTEEKAAQSRSFAKQLMKNLGV